MTEFEDYVQRKLRLAYELTKSMAAERDCWKRIAGWMTWIAVSLFALGILIGRGM